MGYKESILEFYFQCPLFSCASCHFLAAAVRPVPPAIEHMPAKVACHNGMDSCVQHKLSIEARDCHIYSIILLEMVSQHNLRKQDVIPCDVCSYYKWLSFLP